MLDTPSEPRTTSHLQPVIRRRQHHSWEALADAGFTLPLVSVVVFAEPNCPGIAALETTLSSLGGQTYPNLEILIVGRLSTAEQIQIRTVALGGESLLRFLTDSADDAEAVWHAVLAAARGEYLAPLAAGQTWEPRKVAAAIASLVRKPQAAAAYDGRLPDSVARLETLAGRLTIRCTAPARVLQPSPAGGLCAPLVRLSPVVRTDEMLAPLYFQPFGTRRSMAGPLQKRETRACSFSSSGATSRFVMPRPFSAPAGPSCSRC
jgi:hypothetical protein